MDNDIKEFIENLTEKIICSYGIDIPIIKMEDVIKKIGGNVSYRNSYYDLIDGNIKKTGDRSFQILLPILRKNNNNNIMLASYLANIFLHMGYRTNKDLWCSFELNKQYKFLSATKEEQSELFAFSLLMPKKEFTRVFYKNVNNNLVDITEMSKYFRTSTNVIRIRARMLKLLHYSSKYDIIKV